MMKSRSRSHPVRLPQLMLALALTSLVALPDAAHALSEEQRAEQQQELDAACEVARQKRLVPERKRMVEQCVKNGERDSPEACERFYADYGNRAGNRPALYYDLPECVEAFEYRRNYRSSD